MADSAVSILDSNSVAVPIDAATIGTDYQQTVTLGDGTNAGRYAKMDSDGSVLVKTNVAATAAKTNVTSSTSSVTLLASNAARRGAIFFNDSTSVLFLSYGSTAASATSFTTKLAAGGVYFLDVPCFTGEIRGIWTTANGFCRVTDISP